MKKRTYPTEIDIIATDKSEKNFIICKCKFRPELFDNEELRKLKKMALPGETYYYLFSLPGFTDAVIDAAKNDGNLFQ